MSKRCHFKSCKSPDGTPTKKITWKRNVINVCANCEKKL